MGVIQTLGLICGCVSLLFAAMAAMRYFKIKKLFNLIDESQYDKVMPIVEQQRRRVYIEVLLCSLFTIATVIFTIVNNF